MGLMDKVKNSMDMSYEDVQANKELAQQEKDKYEAAQSELQSVFKPIKRMGDIEIDEEHKLLKINNARAKAQKAMGNGKKAALAMMTGGLSLAVEAGYKFATSPDAAIFKFEDIRDYQLLEDDIAVATGGAGAAIVGGALAGPMGGVVGGMVGKKKTKKSVETLAVQISTNNMYFPSVIITYIKKETKTKSSAYADALSKAQQTMSCLDYIVKDNEKNAAPTVHHVEVSNTGKSPAEELKEMKELVDMGIITAEEFEAKKKQLLGL